MDIEQRLLLIKESSEESITEFRHPAKRLSKNQIQLLPKLILFSFTSLATSEKTWRMQQAEMPEGDTYLNLIGI